MAGIFSFAPSVDSRSKEPFLPEHPTEMAKNGVSVPLMLGYTNKEGLLLVPNPYDARPRKLMIIGCKFEDFDEIDENFGTYLHPRWARSIRENYGLDPQDVKKLYFGDKRISANSLLQWTDYFSDTVFIEGIHELVEYQIQNKSISTFLYVLTYDGGRSFKDLMNIELPGKYMISRLSFAWISFDIICFN